MSEIDLLAVRRGSITAPAGCGKTQLIADTLKKHREAKPALVLTHTNAGKAALEQRLKCAEVPASSYRVSTIDSWVIRLATRFPLRSGLNPNVINVENPKTDYPAIRAATASLLKAGHIEDALKSTYSQLLVDEYQDCGLDQHSIIVAAANTLPTVVLGDPLQAIFGFAGPTVGWKEHVWPEFPHLAKLDTPWRWRNTGAESLGCWLLGMRSALYKGEAVDLRHAPPEVVWIQLQGDETAMHIQRMDAARFKAPNQNGSVVVIGESTNPSGHRKIACSTPGAVTVEAVDLKDFTGFGKTFDPKEEGATAKLVGFAADMMTNLSQKALLERLEVLRRGRARTPPSPIEFAATEFQQNPSLGAAALTLRRFASEPGVRVFRPEVFRMCVSALEAASSGVVSLYDAVVRERERNRHTSRRVARRAVGSTLLLKGLEADVSVVLYPMKMTGRDLYVAMTRGSRCLVVCSRSPLLIPAK